MPRFFRRFAEGVFDEEDVKFRAQELADFVTAAAAKYDFETSQLTAVGYSNGANIAAAMLLLRPEALRSAVLFRAMMPLSNAATPDLTGQRILLSAGDSDPIIPTSNVRALASLLQRGGADVQLEVSAPATPLSQLTSRSLGSGFRPKIATGKLRVEADLRCCSTRLPRKRRDSG